MNLRDQPLRLATLEVAREFYGLEEAEGHRNLGPGVEWMQKAAKIPPGSPWCAAFLNAAAEVACAIHDVRSPLEEVPLQGYVQSYHEHAEERGWLVGPEEVTRGDLFMIWSRSKVRYAHIGLVTGPPYDGWEYATIEGNTNEGGSPEGYMVTSRIRPVNELVAFARWTP